jgi:ATP phosphoribosyltransferase
MSALRATAPRKKVAAATSVGAHKKRSKEELAVELLDDIGALSRKDAIKFICGLTTYSELEDFSGRKHIRGEIERSMEIDGRVSFSSVARTCKVSDRTVARVYQAICKEYPPPKPAMEPGTFTLAVPKETRGLEIVEDMLINAGFGIHTENKRLCMGYAIDMQSKGKRKGHTALNFLVKYVRGSEIPRLLECGDVQLALAGNDKVLEFAAGQVCNRRRQIKLSVLNSFKPGAFRMRLAAPEKMRRAINQNWPQYLQGKRIATSYPETLRKYLRESGVRPREIVKMEGSVEQACRLGLAHAVMDVVETGETLKQNGLVVVGKPIYPGKINLYALEGAQFGAQAERVKRFRERLKMALGQLKAA